LCSPLTTSIMKKPIFLLLLTLLALRPLGAQRQLPPSLVPYAAGWTPKFNTLFLRAGFDLSKADDLARRMPVLQSRISALRLDSTIQFIAHSDSLPIVRNVFTYPTDRWVVDTEFYPDGEGWVPDIQTVTISDELGRDVAIIANRYNPAFGTWGPDSRLDIYPHGDSPTLIDSFVVYAINLETGMYDRQLATWRTFDE